MNRFFNPSLWKGLSLPLYLALCVLSFHTTQAQNSNRNTKPTLLPIPDYSTRFSTDVHYIEIHGITAGDEDDQNVNVTVSTGDKDLIESIDVDLIGNGTAHISYRIKEGATGTATVKVVVTDDGEVPASITRTFRIFSESLHREVANKSVLEEVRNHRLKAFPNPAALSTRIYFSTPVDEKQALVELYSLSGIKIKQLFNGSTTANASYSVDLDSRTLATGVYLVRLTGKMPSADLKLVVAR